MDAQIAAQAVQALAHGPDPWEWGWDAVAAIATAVTFLGGGSVYVWDKISARIAANRRRRIIASGLLHPLQITRNFLRAAAPLLRDIQKYKDDLRGLGEALLEHLGGEVAKYTDAIAEFGEDAACDLAYAVALVVSIDRWAKWLSEKSAGKVLEESLVTDAAFYMEAANQAIESLAGVEEALKKSMPTRVRIRRFGPEPS